MITLKEFSEFFSSTWGAWVLYGVCWLLFALIHSTMASQMFKNRWLNVLGPLACFERLIFNAISALAIVFVFFVGRNHLANTLYFAVSDGWMFLLWGVRLLGFGLLLVALSSYDLSRFMGVCQVLYHWRSLSLPTETLHISSLHRYVRHPLYSATLLIIWSRPLTPFVLSTNLFATLYFWIGLYWEERRLIELYGLDYTDYQKRVPALVPRIKW